jgi:16S rRNA (adenine1518-N6/adenine1519-N6)-dimethyltransferase
MDLTSKKNVKNLLEKYGAKPLKRLGQNFLINKKVLKEIIRASNLTKDDTILEIGPGIGTLTQELAKKAKRVIAIEKDKKMVQILRDILKDFNNVEIIQEDILKLPITYYALRIISSYKVVANLPYYIVSPIIRKFLELTEVKPLEMILMVQKEVAQRICGKPPNMSILAVSVQFYAKPEIISYVPRGSFWPQPKVDSAIIRLKIKNLKLKINKDLFFKIVKAGFSHPRKQIANNLSKMLKLNKETVKKWLAGSDIKPTQRAETLTVKDWVKLTKNCIINQ